MGFHSVQEMLETAGAEDVLDHLSSTEYVETIADQISSLADEFPGLVLRISAKNVPQFCADLRAGMIERSIAPFIAQGHDAQDLRNGIDPKSLLLPTRIETYALIHASVEMKLDAKTAHTLAYDLKTGISMRHKHTKNQGTPPC